MSDRDSENGLGRRVKRYAQVASFASGLAARVAGQHFFGFEIDKGKHAGDLRSALGNLKGPVMKIAQILATVPDMIPEEYVDELRHLQAHAPPMGWPFVRRRMRTELGNDWQECFAAFDRDAAHAASLGQVHAATAHDGRALAAKLQYPDMRAAVEADLSQFELILKLFNRYDPGLDTSEIRVEIRERILEELDYIREANHIRLYRYMLKGQAGVHVPEVVDDLSTDRLLTMTWLDGAPLLDFRDASQEDRNRIAENLFLAWYRPYHRFGIIHGDPHLGNYSVREDLSINLLDFGCVRIFEPKFVGGVIDLYTALKENDPELAVHAYETWGFEGLSRELIEVLNVWANFLYGPLMDDRVRSIGDGGKPSDFGRQAAVEVRRKLKELGPVKPPGAFVFMDRAAVGLGSVFLHLKAELNWHRLFESITEGFTIEGMQAKQDEALIAAGLEH